MPSTLRMFSRTMKQKGKEEGLPRKTNSSRKDSELLKPLRNLETSKELSSWRVPPGLRKKVVKSLISSLQSCLIWPKNMMLVQTIVSQTHLSMRSTADNSLSSKTGFTKLFKQRVMRSKLGLTHYLKMLITISVRLINNLALLKWAINEQLSCEIEFI